LSQFLILINYCVLANRYFREEREMKSLSDAAFEKRPMVQMLGEWKVEYLQFVQPSNAFKTPVVILGGAFQSFSSFKHDVKELSKDFPVYLINLPGQGSNTQRAGELKSYDHAELLKGWMDQLGISKISLIAYSFGAGIAHHFAGLYPNRVNKLILGGSTLEMRSSVKSLWEASFKAMQEGQRDHFAAGIALNLMNHSQKSFIPEGDVILKSLYIKAQNLTDQEILSYRDEVNRSFIKEKLPPTPECDTLVFTAEHDHLTMPFEGHKMAQKLKAEFVIIKDSDHFVSYEKKDVVTRLYRRFLNGQSLKRMKDIEYFSKSEFPRERIRMNSRWHLNNMAFLDTGAGAFIPVNVLEISNFGCRFYTSFNDHRSIKGKQKFTLYLPDENLRVNLILMGDVVNGYFCGVFQHYDLHNTEKVESYIDRIAMTEDVSNCA
jgi:pimeloyl-ACP methyl ester carboxylesterase